MSKKKPKLTQLIEELHRRIQNIENQTALPKSLESVQALYNFFRKGQLDAYESTIRTINKIYNTNYEERKK